VLFNLYTASRKTPHISLRVAAWSYSAGLLASIVSNENRGRPLTAIPGAPPNLAALPAGCSFAPRCVHASEQCRVERPSVANIGGTRVACWHPVLPLPEVA
jgi:peptide/nickel transport system ATP-binding protein